MDQAAANALVEEAPDGNDWLHEIKYDGYRMHARIDGGKVAAHAHGARLAASL